MHLKPFSQKLFKFIAALSTITLTQSACTYLQYRPLQPMNLPITRVDIPAKAGQQASVLFVMLPGAYDAPKDFIEQGFVAALQQKGLNQDLNQDLNVDVVLLDAHIGYYTNQQIVERLRDEVVQPAKMRGYTQVWLVGISLGGYGSLLYSMRGGQSNFGAPLGIDGVFIMAPFMGSRHLHAEVAKVGGLLAWTPAAEPIAVNGKIDIDDELWGWLKTYSALPTAARTPPIYLGYGVDDRFVASNRLLAAVLPPMQVMTVAGGHTWTPWLALWQQFLKLQPWAATNAAAP